MCIRDRPYRESDPMGGHDPYSASKGAAEIVIAAYRRSFFSVSYTHLARVDDGFCRRHAGAGGAGHAAGGQGGLGHDWQEHRARFLAAIGDGDCRGLVILRLGPEDVGHETLRVAVIEREAVSYTHLDVYKRQGW